MGAGFRRCAIPLHREHEAAAWVAIRNHGCVIDDSVKYESGEIVYQIDLARLPVGDGPAVEERIKRDVEIAVRR